MCIRDSPIGSGTPFLRVLPEMKPWMFFYKLNTADNKYISIIQDNKLPNSSRYKRGQTIASATLNKCSLKRKRK